MEPEDARLAIERHATSKIASAGRSRRRSARSGSAARRCRASRRCRTSRCARARAGSATGTEIRVDGGTVVVGARGRRARRARRSRSPTSSTTCRRGASSSSPTPPKSTQISRLVTQMALGYPEVGFSLTSGGRRLLECPPAAGLARAVLPALRRARRSRRGPQGSRRADDPRLRRRARRSGAGARAAERLRQPPHRQGPDDRARDHRGLQRRDDQGAQPRSAPVHRDPARSRRRQRASDEGGSAVPRAVAGARSAAARARRRARPGPRAGAAVHAVRAAAGRAAADDAFPACSPGAIGRQPLGARDALAPRPPIPAVQRRRLERRRRRRADAGADAAERRRRSGR